MVDVLLISIYFCSAMRKVYIRHVKIVTGKLVQSVRSRSLIRVTPLHLSYLNIMRIFITECADIAKGLSSRISHIQ